MKWRRLRMGLKTVLNLKQEGFFIPYRYADSIPPRNSRNTYPALEAIMHHSEPAMEQFLQEISAYGEIFANFGKIGAPEPRWEQDWFPRLDGAAAYKMVRDTNPKHIIEIGSGHSTRFMARAIKDSGANTQFTAIDPAPRADISQLPIEIETKIVQDVDPALFDRLEAGDILFIDSSHIAMPGSDVDYLFLNILPALQKGVYVHIHDIFLPDEYPTVWEWRGYNEQQAVAGLLTGGYELLFSSHYAATRMDDQIVRGGLDALPLQKDAFETSLWLKRTS
jgi:Methyltransferase domain